MMIKQRSNPRANSISLAKKHVFLAQTRHPTPHGAKCPGTLKALARVSPKIIAIQEKLVLALNLYCCTEARTAKLFY